MMRLCSTLQISALDIPRAVFYPNISSCSFSGNFSMMASRTSCETLTLLCSEREISKLLRFRRAIIDFSRRIETETPSCFFEHDRIFWRCDPTGGPLLPTPHLQFNLQNSSFSSSRSIRVHRSGISPMSAKKLL